MKETTLRDKVRKAYRERGAWAVKIHGGPYQEPGIPDFIACYRGRLVAPELKVNKNKLSPAQLAQMDKIRAAGGITAAPQSVQEALALLDEVDRQFDANPLPTV